MGMNVASLQGHGEDTQPLMDLNTTPLIDVMLVLLVMLIITIPTQLHTIKLFIGNAPGEAPPAVHVVGIDFDGTVSWDGQVMADAAAVEARMREVGAVAEAAQPAVHIRPDRLADYGAVAAVMAAAQRHSVRKMGVVGNERFAG